MRTIILSRKAKGLSEKTLTTYAQHFAAISKHLSVNVPMEDLTKSKLEEMVAAMRDADLSATSIQSYTRTLRAFFSWCREEEIADFWLLIEFVGAAMGVDKISLVHKHVELVMVCRSCHANFLPYCGGG